MVLRPHRHLQPHQATGVQLAHGAAVQVGIPAWVCTPNMRLVAVWVGGQSVSKRPCMLSRLRTQTMHRLEHTKHMFSPPKRTGRRRGVLQCGRLWLLRMVSGE